MDREGDDEASPLVEELLGEAVDGCWGREESFFFRDGLTQVQAGSNISFQKEEEEDIKEEENVMRVLKRYRKGEVWQIGPRYTAYMYEIVKKRISKILVFTLGRV